MVLSIRGVNAETFIVANLRSANRLFSSGSWLTYYSRNNESRNQFQLPVVPTAELSVSTAVDPDHQIKRRQNDNELSTVALCGNGAICFAIGIQIVNMPAVSILMY